MRIAVAGAHLDGFSKIPRHLFAALQQHADVTRWDLPHYQPLIHGTDPGFWAATIAANVSALPRLGAAARRCYDEQLNWPGIAGRMMRRMEQLL